MPGIGIVTNPHSKQNKLKPETPLLLGYILGEHGRMEVTQTLADLDRVAEKFKAREIDILAINGGDGTISRTLSAFIPRYGATPLPKIALLRGGTMNVLASNLNIKGRPEQILFRLCDAFAGGQLLEVTSLRTLKVEGHYGFLYADGISYNFLEEFYKDKKGPIEAGLMALQVGASAIIGGALFKRLIHPTAIRLETSDGKIIEHQSLTVMAATIERMPYGLKMFPFARQDQDRFQFSSVFCKAEEVLKNLWGIATRSGLGKDRAKETYLSEDLRISLMADGHYKYSLDGELFVADKHFIQLQLGPTLEFLLL